jgi:hypothetical protein
MTVRDRAVEVGRYHARVHLGRRVHVVASIVALALLAGFASAAVSSVASRSAAPGVGDRLGVASPAVVIDSAHRAQTDVVDAVGSPATLMLAAHEVDALPTTGTRAVLASRVARFGGSRAPPS